jgi:succinate-acetate transporter protein
VIFIPSFGILESYGADDAVLEHSLGIYLLSWSVLTGLLLIASHRSSLCMVSMFFFLFVTFVLLTASKFNHNESTLIAAGAFGLITSLIAFYCALSGLLTNETSRFLLPIGNLN